MYRNLKKRNDEKVKYEPKTLISVNIRNAIETNMHTASVHKERKEIKRNEDARNTGCSLMCSRKFPLRC